MSKKEIIQGLIEYHYALLDRLWECVEPLSEQHFLSDSGYSHGSVRSQLVHIAQTDTRWMMGMRGDPDSRQFFLDPKDYPDKPGTKALLDDTALKVKNWINTLDDEALEQTPPGFGGPIWQALMHLVNHGTDHRAQILRLLDEYGAPTFDQDLIMHLWSG